MSIAADLPSDAGFDGQFMRGNSLQNTHDPLRSNAYQWFVQMRVCFAVQDSILGLIQNCSGSNTVDQCSVPESCGPHVQVAV